ncbi:MAG: ATP-dependent DNA helicase RecG [Parcubacteria group bacterium GW2011_GWC2_42_12]|nr:MAG: ATP-dependent DNA helicase RecG [Parcubacteria group bacterium GW2011_GWC2_42_12]
MGAATAKKLKKLGILTVRDLLFYFPFRYDDFSKMTPIAELQAETSANVVGQVELIQNKRSWKRRMNITEALVSDGKETLKVIWFNQPFITRLLQVGSRVSLSGRVEDGSGGLAMISPVYERIGFGQAVHTQGLVPNYHLTANLTQKQIRFLIKQVIGLANLVADWLPSEIRKPGRLIGLAEAIKKINFPKNSLDIKKARERLAFQELFLIQLQSQLVKKNLSLSRAPAIEFCQTETKRFVDSLPFKLTDAQRKAAWEILRGLAKDRPMSRLLEGDVGSGKTIVAIIAMLNVALNNKQAALMVPTEILARQHYETVSRLLSGLGIKVGLVTRTNKLMSNDKFPMSNQCQNPNDKKLNATEIVEKADIIIGTHALIQEDVKFKNLALAIIDEQHRFGVEQRQKLMEKSGSELVPHLLSMTATPIPRSLALALYGDLDLSVIDEMPKDRKKIITKIVAENKRHQAYKFIYDQVREGRQIFVICPLIDLSDKLGVKSVEAEYQKLAKIVFPGLTVGKLHGRLKATEKEKIMREFLDNKIKILVSTSVVEVGVDAPNAAVMMIEGADRFGLAQIHQFRGRVGRSVHQSYCFLFTDNQSEITSRRLRALVDNHNGFALAKLDLKFRGPGEVYGLEQKGFPELKMATLFDYGLMKKARTEAIKLIALDSSLNSWPDLKEKLGEWERGAHLE